MIEGTPSRSALFVNGTIGGYVPAYDYFIKNRKYINSINSSHVETVVLLSRIKGKNSIHVDIDLNDDDLTKTESKATYQQIQEYVEKIQFKGEFALHCTS